VILFLLRLNLLQLIFLPLCPNLFQLILFPLRLNLFRLILFPLCPNLFQLLLSEFVSLDSVSASSAQSPCLLSTHANPFRGKQRYLSLVSFAQ
jgi:hypothetical protein